MRTIDRGVLALATLALAGAAGCSGAAPAPPPAPSPSPAAAPSAAPVVAPPVTAPPTTTPAPPAPPAPARDGTNLKACADGACQVEVRGPQQVTVRGSDGSVTLRIEPLPPDGVRVRTQDGGLFEIGGAGSEVSLREGVTVTADRGTGGSVVVTMRRS